MYSQLFYYDCKQKYLTIIINIIYLMHKVRDIPFSRMRNISDSGVFVKRFGQIGKTRMKPYAHRDDYYMVVLLTDGSAKVDIDFERVELCEGNLLIVAPWQVHGKPADEVWNADGWMLAFSPEILSESDVLALEEYSVSPHPFNPGETTIRDIVILCSMLERNKGNDTICNSLASAVKSYVLFSMKTSDKGTSGRYNTITLKLRKLLDIHIAEEKSPAVYASMLNISEVYLNEAVKGVTGLSVGSYIRSRVLVQAKRQLSYTSLSAKEIAYALGYDDYVYFSKLFKKHVGKSPSEFRKNLK